MLFCCLLGATGPADGRVPPAVSLAEHRSAASLHSYYSVVDFSGRSRHTSRPECNAGAHKARMVFLLQFPASQINLSQRERIHHIVS